MAMSRMEFVEIACTECARIGTCTHVSRPEVDGDEFDCIRCFEAKGSSATAGDQFCRRCAKFKTPACARANDPHWCLQETTAALYHRYKDCWGLKNPRAPVSLEPTYHVPVSPELYAAILRALKGGGR